MATERDPKFYSELKQLNEDLLTYLKSVHEKSPYFDLSPTVNSYVKQINDLLTQYPEKSTIITSSSSATITNSINNNVTFSSAASTLSPPTTTTTTTALNPKAPPFTPFSSSTLFGSSLIGGTDPPTLQPFSFGATLNPISTAPTSLPNSTFSFTLPKKEDQQPCNNNSDAEDDAPPPEPKIEKYEEPDAKHSVRCKLYERVKGETNVSLAGVGNLYVKTIDASRNLQIIIRQEPDLRRVLLNEVVTPITPVKMLPKAVQLAFPGPNGDTQFYVVKLRDQKDAAGLYEMLNFSKT